MKLKKLSLLKNALKMKAKPFFACCYFFLSTIYSFPVTDKLFFSDINGVKLQLESYLADNMDTLIGSILKRLSAALKSILLETQVIDMIVTEFKKGNYEKIKQGYL